MVAARPGVFVHSSHVMNTTAPAAIPGRIPFSAGAPGAHIAHGALTRPHRALFNHTVEERGIERSAASLDTHGHACRSQSSARSPGPVWRDRARRCVRASQSLGKALGSVLLPCAGASPLRVAAAWYLPAGSSMITAGTLPSSALRRRRRLHGIMCGPF